ncbi:hypothetical protein CR513_23880, partial [Mucuna pruriens]
MTSIFSDLLQDCKEVFMDDFMVYADSFDACLENISKVLRRCSHLKLIAELKDEHTKNTFQVNGHKIKPFHEGLV